MFIAIGVCILQYYVYEYYKVLAQKKWISSLQKTNAPNYLTTY